MVKIDNVDKINIKAVMIISMKDISDYCDTYAELKRVLGSDEGVIRIYEHYNGLTISFPKKLYSQEYVRNYITDNYGQECVQDIARRLNLSERRIRQLASELKVNMN